MALKVKFSQTYLNDLVENSDSGVVVEANRTKYLIVSPIQLVNLKECIIQYLDSLVGKYDPELSGIILSHRRIRIDPQLKVRGDGTNKLLYIADIYVFKPKVGSFLTGVVNKKSEDHLGCLVHRVFNIALLRPDGVEEGEWQGLSVSVGQDVRFKVIGIDMSESIPYIRGELISLESESTTALDNFQSLNGQESSVNQDIDNDQFSHLKRIKSQKRKIAQEKINEDSSPSKKIRKRTVSTCEESTVTMLLNDVFAKFLPKKRKSTENNEHSIEENRANDASLVKDLNQVVDVKKQDGKSRKSKIKSAVTRDNCMGNLVENDGNTVEDLNSSKKAKKKKKKMKEKECNNRKI